MNWDEETLDAMFGTGSTGDTPEARAATSTLTFVRSQMQLAPATPRATGRLLTAREALDSFGPDALEKVAFDGKAVIVADADEPARTIEARRRHLGLSRGTVARRSEVSDSDVENAESPGTVTSIHALLRIAETLSLDDRLLSRVAGAGGDERLGHRFRDMGGSTKHDEQLIATLSEAAWVIRRQVELDALMGDTSGKLTKFAGGSSDYRYKTSERGYLLAARTRMLLQIDAEAPIQSVRALAERVIGAPVLQAFMGRNVAGATISNGGARGIVLSNTLHTQPRSLFRRLTIAHELGHLLWDPDDRLQPVQVDGVDEIGTVTDEGRLEEMRANAFAVSFLAPAAGVRRINASAPSPAQALLRIVRTYGISAPAARFHLSNTCRIRIDEIPLPNTTVAANTEWHRREDAPVDGVVPGIPGIPELRNGRFAELVIAAARRNLISADTAASWLRCERAEIERAIQPR